MTTEFNDLARTDPRRVLLGLMLAETLGDVHDEINLLHDHFGLPRPSGDFIEGFTKADFQRVKAGDDR